MYKNFSFTKENLNSKNKKGFIEPLTKSLEVKDVRNQSNEILITEILKKQQQKNKSKDAYDTMTTAGLRDEAKKLYLGYLNYFNEDNLLRVLRNPVLSQTVVDEVRKKREKYKISKPRRPIPAPRTRRRDFSQRPIPAKRNILNTPNPEIKVPILVPETVKVKPNIVERTIEETVNTIKDWGNCLVESGKNLIKPISSKWKN